MDKEQEVRLIAYSIWEEENCPDGRDCEHWFRAETIWEASNNAKAKNKKQQKTQAKNK